MFGISASGEIGLNTEDWVMNVCPSETVVQKVSSTVRSPKFVPKPNTAITSDSLHLEGVGSKFVLINLVTFDPLEQVITVIYDDVLVEPGS